MRLRIDNIERKEECLIAITVELLEGVGSLAGKYTFSVGSNYLSPGHHSDAWFKDTIVENVKGSTHSYRRGGCVKLAFEDYGADVGIRAKLYLYWLDEDGHVGRATTGGRFAESLDDTFLFRVLPKQ